MRILVCLAIACLQWATGSAIASEIGVTPVAVRLDAANNRASLTVVNSGTNAVVMQVEAIEWKAGVPDGGTAPTSAMVINPSVFTLQAGQMQLVRVGLRHVVPADQESTYRIVLREVPAAPRLGETRIGGQVRVLMALRVPVYVAPANVVREVVWHATQAHDGSVSANVRNAGNAHVRIGSIQLRSADGAPLGPEVGAAVVLAGDSQQFRIRGASTDRGPLTLDVVSSDGKQSIAVATALR